MFGTIIASSALLIFREILVPNGSALFTARNGRRTIKVRIKRNGCKKWKRGL